MKRKSLVLVIFLFFIVGSLFAFAVISQKRDELIDSSLASTKLIKECQDVPMITDIPIYGNCSYETSSIVCNNELSNLLPDENQLNNAGCINQTKKQMRDCIVSYQKVESVTKQCDKEKGFLINDVVHLSTQDYVCSASEVNEQTTVICDSKYDGNGDGKCTSGESCQEFIIYGKSVIKMEKNSKDEFKETDNTYFLQKATAEVLQ